MKWQNDETTTKLIKTRATPMIRITLMMIMIIIFFFGLCSPLAGEPGHCPLSLSLDASQPRGCHMWSGPTGALL